MRWYLAQHGIERHGLRQRGGGEFFSNLKNELIHHADISSREAARAVIFSYIELFYNRQRIHQSLGYVSPVAFEEANCVALN
ncbi:MAG: IS3 family transposase [Nitrosomonadales bacterium]|nr:IS3 family transposase [Nitrosomonadales bacterium]